MCCPDRECIVGIPEVIGVADAGGSRRSPARASACHLRTSETSARIRYTDAEQYGDCYRWVRESKSDSLAVPEQRLRLPGINSVRDSCVLASLPCATIRQGHPFSHSCGSDGRVVCAADYAIFSDSHRQQEFTSASRAAGISRRADGEPLDSGPQSPSITDPRNHRFPIVAFHVEHWRCSVVLRVLGARDDASENARRPRPVHDLYGGHVHPAGVRSVVLTILLHVANQKHPAHCRRTTVHDPAIFCHGLRGTRCAGLVGYSDRETTASVPADVCGFRYLLRRPTNTPDASLVADLHRLVSVDAAILASQGANLGSDTTPTGHLTLVTTSRGPKRKSLLYRLHNLH